MLFFLFTQLVIIKLHLRTLRVLHLGSPQLKFTTNTTILIKALILFKLIKYNKTIMCDKYIRISFIFYTNISYQFSRNTVSGFCFSSKLLLCKEGLGKAGKALHPWFQSFWEIRVWMKGLLQGMGANLCMWNGCFVFTLPSINYVV